MKRQIMKALAVGILLALPTVASAATNGVATTNVNMRSGPSTSYPAVVVIPAGAPISINGCLSNVNWCDVTFARGRGWVSGNYIQATYRQNRVYVGPQYYRPLGIPTVTFDVDNYWGRYYRDRDFYRERDRWRGWDYRRVDAPPPRWDNRRPDPGFDRDRYRDDNRYRDQDRYRNEDRYRNDDRYGNDDGYRDEERRDRRPRWSDDNRDDNRDNSRDRNQRQQEPDRRQQQQPQAPQPQPQAQPPAPPPQAGGDDCRPPQPCLFLREQQRNTRD
ncbi:SH3 domain-containing protein [Rhizobium sp. SAFR-030]|uniref:SH3 domain-containing protein n=1 Tax=Rhizobium sp. SAFR-030 TaxID=3387277 RepID=UPI003F800D44